MSIRVQNLKHLTPNEVIDELKRRHVVIPKSPKKDAATLLKRLKEIVTEEVRRENEDPEIVQEDVIIRIQEQRKYKVSQFSQIFDEHAGSGLFLHKSRKIKRLMTEPNIETLREIVRSDKNNFLFAGRFDASKTRRFSAFCIGENRKTAKEFFNKRITQNKLLSEARIKNALQLVFAILDVIKQLDFYKTIEGQKLVDEKDFVMSIISNFGSLDECDTRQPKHTDFSKKGEYVINIPQVVCITHI